MNIQRVLFLFLLKLIVNPVLGNGELISPKLSYEDSVYYSLSKKERISKLMLLPIADFKKADDLEIANKIIKGENVGGIIIHNGEKQRVKTWIQELKSSGITTPPFVALKIDELLGPPLDGFGEFPGKHQIELLSNDSLLIDFGYLMGREIEEIGFDMVIVDAKTEYIDNWISKYIKGLELSGVTIAVHNQGDSTKRSQINIGNVGHLGLSIGYPLYKDSYLPELCFTELENGSDMVYLPGDISRANTLLASMYDIKPPKKKLLKEKGKNVIKFKRKLEALGHRPFAKRKIDEGNLYLKTLLGSVVLLKNEKGIFPIKNLDQYDFSSLAGNGPHDQIFREYIEKYARVAHYDFDYINDNPDRAIRILNHFDIILVNLSPNELRGSNDLLKHLQEINKKSDVVVIYSGDKKELEKLSDFPTVLWVPENNSEYAQLIPQNIFGALEISGRQQYFINEDSIGARGEYIPAIGRLKYDNISTSISMEELLKIDIIVRDAIQLKAFPGCQVFMAKNGTVVYNKSFGYLTYDSMVSVENQSVFDIASITKVAATVPSLMFLEDWKKISITDTLGHHVSEYGTTDKSGLIIQDLLTHQSGLRSYLPFWRNAEFDPEGDDFRFKLPRKRRYKYKTESINWNDSISSWIASSKFNSLKKEAGGYDYLYSDLGFMTLKDLAESKLKQPLDVFLSQNLYAPLGMTSTGFEPLCQWPLDMIAPTEQDVHLRNGLVWGKVHDRNAALLGGVSGHAGLFSTASDLGKYMQMHLQGGYYGGQKYFSEKTIQRFIEKPEGSDRRALGWDRPDITVENASKYASSKAFGHSGFTGTIVWADPEYDLVYVFLSNRVYPDAQNNKLIQNNIRTRIHDIMYESFIPGQ